MPTTDLIHGDRRVDRRYAFEMPMRFFYRSGGSEYAGTGRTQDFCRKGVRFVTDQPIPHHSEVELHIEWPFLLQDVCPLELRVWGRTMRSDDGGGGSNEQVRVLYLRGAIFRSGKRPCGELEHCRLRGEQGSQQTARRFPTGLALKQAALRSVPPLHAHRATASLHLIHGLGAEFRRQCRQRPSRRLEHSNSALPIQNHQGIARLAAFSGGDLQDFLGPVEECAHK